MSTISLYFPTSEDITIKPERSYLGADVTAGASVTLTIENNENFKNSDFVVIGYEGSELAELEQINQVVTAGQSIRVATVKFNHKKGEPVTRYAYDKRKVYGSTSESGSYTELTSDGSPVLISVDDPQGTVFEYTGGSYTWFKATYYNSTSFAETPLANAEAIEGNQSLRYTTIYNIRKAAGLAGNPFYSDFVTEIKRKQAENEIDSVLLARYTLPLTEVPALLTHICTLLAAGYIDFEEFGKNGEGVKWLGEARALLKNIADGKRRLIGSDGTELTHPTGTGSISGYPNDADTNPAKFTMDDQF